jgi:WD40 repeat protein
MGSLFLWNGLSLDGKYIATTGFNDDRRVIVWDALTGQELLLPYNPSSRVARVAFSPDGKHLAAMNMDGTTRIYVLPIEDVMALAQSRLTRSMTDAECQKYLHTNSCPAEGS